VRKIAIALLAAGALATSFTPVAHAAAPSATDSDCGFTTATDNSPEAPENSQTGVLYGGPIAQNGTLTCTIKVNVGTHAGAYVNGATRSATGTNGTTVLQPGVVSYISPPGEPVYSCAAFNDGSVNWVLDARTNTWVNASTTPDAECHLAISGGTDDPIFDPIFDLLDLVGTTLDTVICPVLAELEGDYAGLVTINAQGDVFIAGDPFWDCPPYDLFG